MSAATARVWLKVQLALDWMKCSVKKRNHEDQHRGIQCLSQLPEVNHDSSHYVSGEG